MSKHTSGPCEILDFDGAQFCVIGPSSEGPRVILATCTGAEAINNAQFFAATPDLLKACKLSLEWLDEVTNPDNAGYLRTEEGVAARAVITAAIAKAEGSEHD